MRLFTLLYHALPVYTGGHDEHPALLNDAERARIRHRQAWLAVVAALLSVAGFLAFYLPVYWYPHVFPVASVTLPGLGRSVVAWGELLWAALLAAAEILLLTMLNIVAVHEVAVATGFLNVANKTAKAGDVLHISLEQKTTDVTRYGIDPFQGSNTWALLAFNMLLKLKGWLGNRVMRFLTRTLLVRYAARAVLDFAGLPLYMAINAYSILAVTREAKVILMGQPTVERLVNGLPRFELSDAERELLYDTLQFIAVSKRDFHRNHYLLTKALLDRFQIPVEANHLLPDDFLLKLAQSPTRIKALCQAIILLGFILDGRLSWRERRKLHAFNAAGTLNESPAAVRQHLRNFRQGRGVDAMLRPYLQPVSTR